MTDLEVIAYCPFPSYDARHAYLTTAPNRQGATWHCADHSPKMTSKAVLNAWMRQILLGDLEHAIEVGAPLEHRIYLAREYQRAVRGEHG